MTGPPAAPYRGVRALVLGAGGFIGGWVARLLAEQGADLQLVRRDDRHPKAMPRRATMAGPVLRADLATPGAVRDLIAAVRPAIVFNLAGYGVDPAERDTATAERLNAELPPAIAAALAEHGDRGWRGQQIVHAGSALEYGTATGDLREETPASPTTLYGRTKLEGTRRLNEAAQHLGVRATTGRMFTVYGPGEHDGRLLPTLVAASRTDGPIRLTAGTQQRDFTYVADAAEGLLRLGVVAAPAHRTVNVATGTLTTVRAFTEIAAEVLGIAPGRLDFGVIATRTEEMQHDPVNIERLRALTTWSPAVTIAQGVARTVAFGAPGALRP